MGKLLLASAGSALAVGLIAGGTLDTGRRYPLTMAETRSRLASLETPDAAIITSAAGAGPVERILGEREVRWRVRGGDGDTALYIAELTPVNDVETRVRLHIKHQTVGQPDRLTSTRFLRGFGNATFAEAVDAALETSPDRRLTPVRDWAEQVSRDPEQLREFGQAIGSMYAELPRAVHGEAASASPRPFNPEKQMEAATRPMINPVPN